MAKSSDEKFRITLWRRPNEPRKSSRGHIAWKLWLQYEQEDYTKRGIPTEIKTNCFDDIALFERNGDGS